MILSLFLFSMIVTCLDKCVSESLQDQGQQNEFVNELIQQNTHCLLNFKIFLYHLLEVNHADISNLTSWEPIYSPRKIY